MNFEYKVKKLFSLIAMYPFFYLEKQNKLDKNFTLHLNKNIHSSFGQEMGRKCYYQLMCASHVSRLKSGVLVVRYSVKLCVGDERK